MHVVEGIDLAAVERGLCDGRVVATEVVATIAAALERANMGLPNVIEVEPPRAIVGNLHGDASALDEVYAVGGRPPDTSYVFLGGLVNRGGDSVAVCVRVMIAALRWPSRVTLLRSGHETRAATEMYGLREECLALYGGDGPYEALLSVFNTLPLAAVIGGSVFAVSGGLSPSVYSVDALDAVDRFTEVPPDGVLTDLMWSMPSLDTTASDPEFTLSPRGLGYAFTKVAVADFLDASGLSSIVVGNILTQEGHAQVFPGMLDAVWSAPNFLGRAGNAAALVHILEDMEMVWVSYSQPMSPPEPRASLSELLHLD